MKYGSALPADFHIPKSGFWLRKDLEERSNPFEAVTIEPGDVVMDCGAYIGTFAVAALMQGASRAVCYEAAPKNAALLRSNTSEPGDRVTVIEAALIPTNEETAALSLSGFTGSHSILPSINRPKTVQVRAVNFREELLRVSPQVLKLDVEGAEYDLFKSLSAGDLQSVRCLFIEFHPIEDRDAMIAAVTEFVLGEGLVVISPRRRAFVAKRGAP